jgi:uncharacterized protein involved in outer membrane biogenesis
VHIEPASGLAALKGFELGNPPGFKTPRAIELGEVSLQMEVASLTTDVVRIREIRILAPHVTYERGDSGSNLEVIERNVQSYVAAQTAALGVGGSGAGGPGGKSGKQKKLIIDNLYIQGAKADVSAAMLEGRALSVPINDIHLQGIGEKTGGATPAEVTSQVVGAVTRSVTRSVTTAPVTGLVNGIKNGAKAAVDAVKGLFK